MPCACANHVQFACVLGHKCAESIRPKALSFIDECERTDCIHVLDAKRVVASSLKGHRNRKRAFSLFETMASGLAK